MATRNEIYKCAVCGNITAVVHGAAGELVCCGQPMNMLVENSVDAAQEKHVPVISKVGGGYQVKVGSVAHPMEDKHYIEWIELAAGNHVYRCFLQPDDLPEADFKTAADEVTARAYCNLHGLWRN